MAVVPAALLVLSACGDSPAEVANEIRIDGPDTHRLESLGQTVQLTATVTGPDQPDITWRSLNQRVVSVDRSGLVRALDNGTAEVAAVAGGAGDTITVTVEQVVAGLAFLVQPDHVVRDESFYEPVRVAIADALGSPVRNASATITLSLDNGGGGGALGGTTVRTPEDGVAEFDDLVPSAIGSGFRLRATGGGLNAQSIAFDVVAAPDVILVRNTTPNDNGFLIDGSSARGAVNDRGVVTADSVAEVILSLAPQTNETAVFTRGRPPVLAQAGWTSGTDTVNVTFPAPMSVPITIWVVKGPYNQQAARAADAVATTISIFDEERLAIGFSEVEFIDATGDPDAAGLHNHTLCNSQLQLTNAIGKRAGRINIYYVGVLDNGTDRGRACPGADFIIMAERSGHELLAHEIGHTFTLGHVDGDPQYNQTNVMHSASNTRRYFTEGQVFRSHYNSSSSVRFVYSLRSDPVRNCSDFQQSPGCPALVRRLWDDGSFPSNSPAVVRAPVIASAPDAVTQWLASNCGVGGETVSAATLRALGDGAVDRLIRAFEQPDRRTAQQIAVAAAERWAERRTRISSGERFGLDDAALTALLAVDQPAYIARAVADFEANYRLAAVHGLAIIRTARAIGHLETIAADVSSPWSATARAALIGR
jgi:hypothetical protein